MKRRTFISGIGAAATSAALLGCSSLSGIVKYRAKMPKGEIPRVALGKTGIMVSRFGFGSHLKAELISKPRYRDQMIKLGFEGGINTFDVYDHGGYKQFEPMGKSLRGFRKEAIVSLCAVRQTGELQAEIDDALNKFFTDYIDLYRLYAVDDDRMAIMEKNKKDGKIRAIGVVSHDADTMMKYLDRYGTTLDFVMIVYNFHHNNGAFNVKGYVDNDYSALIPRCEGMNLGILGIKPMGSDHMIELARKEGFFNDTQANPARAMLRYVFREPHIDCTMTAMNSMDELFGNLEASYNTSLSSYEEHLLKQLSDTAAATKRAYLPDRYRWLENWASNFA